MRLMRCYFLLLIILIFTSCGISQSNKSEAQIQSVFESNNKSFETQQLKSLEIKLENADINFSSWAKKEVKIEIETQITGNGKKDALEKAVSDNKPKVSFNDDTLSISEANTSKNKNLTISNKVKVSAPCEIRNLLVSVKNGSFTSFGDIVTSAAIKVEKGSINFSRFQGELDAKASYGNIAVESGRLSGPSSIMSQSGNVNIKTEILTNESYKFEVGVGNIDLKLPAKTYGDFSCQGNIAVNEFKSSSTGPKILVSAREGAINLKKY